MIIKLPSRHAGWFYAAFAFAASAASSSALAQVNRPAQLESVVVSATRTPQTPGSTPSSVSQLSLPDLASAQIEDLRSALIQSPGLTIANSGAEGSQSSIFLRGASSHQTLFVVDGVRMSSRSALYQNYLGSADLAGIDRIEVLRGPQGTLYGSSAMGGVVLLETAHGYGAPSGSIQAGAGSFSTFGASASVMGGIDRLGASASLSRIETDNDRPGNAFEQWSASARVEGNAFDSLLVGATLRSQDGDYEEPGSRLWPSPGQVEADNRLVTVYARLNAGKEFDSRLTVAWHRRDYSYADSWGASTMQNTRRYADWQNTWQAAKSTEFVLGATRELSRYEIGSSATEDRSTSFYLSSLVKPTEDIALTAGLRHDDFSSFGGTTTWRAGASYILEDAGTTVRGTYGTGFTAPGSDDRFGVPSWGMLGNPGLEPEKSRGWDCGISQTLIEGKLSVDLTWFDTRYRGLFEWETVDFTTYQGRIVNRARASAKGMEFAIEAKPVSCLSIRGSYTQLEANDDTNAQRLNRRPRHVGSAELRYSPGKAWVLGAGLRVVAKRLENGAPIEDFSTVRLFASYRMNSGLVLKLRVENLLDESYEEVLGYPALPLALHSALEWRF